MLVAQYCRVFLKYKLCFDFELDSLLCSSSVNMEVHVLQSQCGSTESSTMGTLENHCYNSYVMPIIIFHQLLVAVSVFKAGVSRFCQKPPLVVPRTGCHSNVKFPSQHICRACVYDLEVFLNFNS